MGWKRSQEVAKGLLNIKTALKIMVVLDILILKALHWIIRRRRKRPDALGESTAIMYYYHFDDHFY